MILIKLGGSVISTKDVPFSFNNDIVTQIAREIKLFHPDHDIIVVHGGGSYGHPLASQYKIRDGFTPDKSVGISKTHQAMLDLNNKIINIFQELSLPAFSVSPSSLFFIENGDIVYGDIKVVRSLVDKHFIPTLFGDVAVSVDRGIDILSGDQIVTYLAKELTAEKVVFLMDVDGIYDKNPKEDGSAMLLRNIDDTSSVVTDLGAFDVTGGISNKIIEARKLSCPVYFINGTVEGNLTKALNDEPVGTRFN